MTEIKIVRQMPMAGSLRKPPPPRRKYPFNELEIGDGFFLAGRSTNNLSNQASTIGRKLGRKFKTMLTYMSVSETGWERCEKGDPDAQLGIGVWRTK